MSSKSITENDLRSILDGVILGSTEYMIAVPSNNQTLSSQNTIIVCNIDSVHSAVGTRLTLDSTNHKIIIGEGVHHVEVTGQIYIYTVGTSGVKNVYIYKNSTCVSRGLANISNNYVSLATAPKIISVTSGDEITLRANSQNGTTTVLSDSDDAAVAFLQVRILD